MANNTLAPLSEDELNKLANLAIGAKAKAYCPYSNFRVGASILLSDGTFHTGANVEVAATPVGICAERCAIAPIVASMPRPDMPVIRAIGVATDIFPPASPCGMCRQFINEFATSRDLPIYMYGKEGLEGEVVRMTIGELLPMSFGPNDLDRNPGKSEGVGLGKIQEG
ncbi:Cytidine deaminase [Fonsecaea pedrosoi]|nr:Cytidine deaminase [Fonsecaea pedrosoi]